MAGILEFAASHKTSTNGFALEVSTRHLFKRDFGFKPEDKRA
jgi:hypothetical protein